MEYIIDADDMLDMLFGDQVDVLTRLPLDILMHIMRYLAFKDIIAFQFTSSRVNSIIQDGNTWKKLSLEHEFAFIHDVANDWKKYYFEHDKIKRALSHSFSGLRLEGLYASNETWIVVGRQADAFIDTLDKSNYICIGPVLSGGIQFCQLIGDLVLLGDRTCIHIYDLSDTTYTDIFQSTTNINVVMYDPLKKLLFAGTESGEIFFWRKFVSRVKDPVRNEHNFKGHDGAITALHIPIGVTDTMHRIVSGGKDTTIIIWGRRSRDGEVDYEQELVLVGHQFPIKELLSCQNKLISTDTHTIKIWDILTGQNSFTYPVAPEFTISCQISSDNNLIAGVIDGDVRVWNANTGECNSQFSLDLREKEQVKGILLQKGHVFVFTALGDELTLVVWNVVSRSVVTRSVYYTDHVQYPIPASSFKIQLLLPGNTCRILVASTGISPTPAITHLCFDFNPLLPSPPSTSGEAQKRRKLA